MSGFFIGSKYFFENSTGHESKDYGENFHIAGGLCMCTLYCFFMCQ